MPLPRLPCAAALALASFAATTAPAAAQGILPSHLATDAIFLGHLAGAPTLIGTPLAAHVEAGSSDEDEASGSSWLDGKMRYVAGGAAAIAAGIALAGNDDAASLSTVSITPPAVAPTAAPTTAPTGAPPAVAPADLGSTNVIVNPEPGTVLLLGTGLAILVIMGRRRIGRG